jgi:hypothetical protein
MEVGDEGEVVTYEEHEVNVGSAMLLNGTFIAPVDGLYFFSFHCHERNVPSSKVSLRVDEEAVSTFLVKSTDADFGPVGFSTLLSLDTDQHVDVHLESGSIFAHEVAGAKFMGFLLYEQHGNYETEIR